MNTMMNLDRAFARVDALQQSPTHWADPRPITTDLPPAPVFDAGVMLPAPLATFVLDEADRMSAAPDYVATALLVALGSVIGTQCAIKPKRRDDWLVTPNLYGGVVGEPSAKKSPTVGTVMRFLDGLEAKEVANLAELSNLFSAEMAVYDAVEGSIKADLKRAVSGKRDPEKLLAAQQDLEQLERPQEPQPRRFKSNDATVEKLADLLSRNPHGLLVCRDELMGLLTSWERDGREGDKAFYLEGWNGTGSFSVDRIGRGSQYIKNLCISVFGGIQPDLLGRYLSGLVNGLDNDGRIQRFQVMVYPEQPAWKWCDRYPVEGAREAVRDLFCRLAYLDAAHIGATPADDFVKLPHLVFSEDSQEVFIEWATELNSQRIPHEANPLMQQHLGKFEKLFCAVALILHLVDGGQGPVNIDSALRAAAWCEYLEGHARRIYGLVEVSKVSTAKLLARRIQEGKLQQGFTARDVAKKGWAGIKNSADAEAALAILEEQAWVIGVEDAPDGGRPTTRYRINPKAKGGM